MLKRPLPPLATPGSGFWWGPEISGPTSILRRVLIPGAPSLSNRHLIPAPLLGKWLGVRELSLRAEVRLPWVEKNRHRALHSLFFLEGVLSLPQRKEVETLES